MQVTIRKNLSTLLENSVIIYKKKIIGARTVKYQGAACSKCIVIKECTRVSGTSDKPMGCHDVLHCYVYSKHSFIIPSDIGVLVNELPLSYYSLFMISIKRKLLYKYDCRLQ